MEKKLVIIIKKTEGTTSRELIGDLELEREEKRIMLDDIRADLMYGRYP